MMFAAIYIGIMVLFALVIGAIGCALIYLDPEHRLYKILAWMTIGLSIVMVGMTVIGIEIDMFS